MARSPAVASPGAIATKKQPVKPKPVTTLQQAAAQKTAALSPSGGGSEDEGAPEDLAERLNWEEKHKYIKGISPSYSQSDLITSARIGRKMTNAYLLSQQQKKPLAKAHTPTSTKATYAPTQKRSSP